MAIVDQTTAQMMEETGHNCLACPVDVRNLYAVAGNALNQWEVVGASVSDGRMHRKMNALRNAVNDWQPIVDAHFAALEAWSRG